MSETLGSLVDKLSIINIRLWHLEDIRRDIKLNNDQRLSAADKVSLVNSQRNDLIDEIDQYLEDVIKGKKVKITFKKHKMYMEGE